MMTRKIGYGFLNEINKLELDCMEHDNMRIEGHKRGHGTFRSLRVMVKLHMMFFDMVKIVKGNFMPLGPVYFHVHSIMLIHIQINITAHYS